MMKTLNWVRVAVAAATLTASATGAGIIAATVATASYGKVVATTAVNVRSGPGTSNSILGVLYPGDSAVQTGPISNGWVPVNYHGKSAWVSAQYLRGVSGAAPAPITSNGGTSATFRTTTYVNIRSGPSTSYAKVGLLSKGATITATGRTSGRFTEVLYKGMARWICSDYLTPVSGTGSTPPPATDLSSLIKYQMRATTALMIRTSSSANFTSLGDVPKGTVLDMTGVTENGVSQIVWKGALRWVNSKYLVKVSSSSTPVTPPTPAQTGTRYTTASYLNIRSTSNPSSRVVGVVKRGTALAITGAVENGMAQVIYRGTPRWASAQYLTATAPDPDFVTGDSDGLYELKGMGKEIVHNTRAMWPQIVTFYGYNPRGSSKSDHSRGLAVDLMIPKYKSNNALGWEIAKWYRANYKKYRIHYIIFNQEIWNITRDREGWRKMADRGSDTANHYDHVHISFYP